MIELNVELNLWNQTETQNEVSYSWTVIKISHTFGVEIIYSVDVVKILEP